LTFGNEDRHKAISMRFLTKIKCYVIYMSFIWFINLKVQVLKKEVKEIFLYSSFILFYSYIVLFFIQLNNFLRFMKQEYFIKHRELLAVSLIKWNDTLYIRITLFGTLWFLKIIAISLPDFLFYRGFKVSVCGRQHIFKPVSVQAMW